ncbi:MAG: hypothetical protein M0R17_01990 [Candidatus Omnitrophica bacterium]|jgi:hypothetical protein|nr:hypothetical protein [Candidatus Omnitrophota bacterium]
MNIAKWYRDRFIICFVLSLVFVSLIIAQVGHELLMWRLLLCYAMSQIFGALAAGYLQGYLMFKDVWGLYNLIGHQLDFVNGDKPEWQ